jgi:hypothetical protein
MPLYKVTYTETRECITYFHADSKAQAHQRMQETEDGDDMTLEVNVLNIREVKIPATGPIRLDAHFNIIEEE